MLDYHKMMYICVPEMRMKDWEKLNFDRFTTKDYEDYKDELGDTITNPMMRASFMALTSSAQHMKYQIGELTYLSSHELLESLYELESWLKDLEPLESIYSEDTKSIFGLDVSDFQMHEILTTFEEGEEFNGREDIFWGYARLPMACAFTQDPRRLSKHCQDCIRLVQDNNNDDDILYDKIRGFQEYCGIIKFTNVNLRGGCDRLSTPIDHAEYSLFENIDSLCVKNTIRFVLTPGLARLLWPPMITIRPIMKPFMIRMRSADLIATEWLKNSWRRKVRLLVYGCGIPTDIAEILLS